MMKLNKKMTAVAPTSKSSTPATRTGVVPRLTSILPSLALPTPLVPDQEDLEPACLLPPLPLASCSATPGIEVEVAVLLETPPWGQLNVMDGELWSLPQTPVCHCHPRVRPPPPTVTQTFMSATPRTLTLVVHVGLPCTIATEVNVATPEGPPMCLG